MRTLFEHAYFFEARDEKVKNILITKYGYRPELVDDMIDAFGKYALWYGAEQSKRKKAEDPDLIDMSHLSRISDNDKDVMNTIIEWVKDSKGKINLRDYSAEQVQAMVKEWQEEKKANIQRNMVAKWRKELEAGEVLDEDIGAKITMGVDYPKGILFTDGSFWINTGTDDISRDDELNWISNKKNLGGENGGGNCGRDPEAETLFVLIGEDGDAHIMASFDDQGKIQRQIKGTANSSPNPEYFMRIAYLIAKLGCERYPRGLYKSESDFQISELNREQMAIYEGWGGNEVETTGIDLEKARIRYQEMLEEQGVDYFIDAGFDFEWFTHYLQNEDDFMEELKNEEKSNTGLSDFDKYDSGVKSSLERRVSVDDLISYLKTEDIEVDENEHVDFIDIYDQYIENIDLDALVSSTGVDESDIVSDIVDARYENQDMAEWLTDMGIDTEWVKNNLQWFDVDRMISDYMDNVDDAELESMFGEN